MAVSQAIGAIETEDPSTALTHARMNMQPPTMERTVSKSQKFRLSLKTMFNKNSYRQSIVSPISTATNSSTRSSPSYKRISRPFINLPPEFTVADLQALLYYELNATSPCSSESSGMSTTGRIRRYPSTIDMALEAERNAPGPENIGLSFLEPRPLTPGAGNIFGRAKAEMPPPVAMDGIFEVMENR